MEGRAGVVVVLVTISFSHYCDKARWVLDRYAVPYVESGWFPLLHMPAVAWLAGPGRADRASSPLSTPVLLIDEHRVLRDSRDIARWVDGTYGGGRLYEDPSTLRWESRLHDGLGVWSRGLVYGLGLPDPAVDGPDTLGGSELLRWLARRNVPRGQARLVSMVAPSIRAGLLRALRLGPRRLPVLRDRLLAELDDIAHELDGPYLVGSRFSAADLSLAAMLAPLTMPPEYGAELPPVQRLPPALGSLVGEVRAHPVGARALELYREQRHRLEPPC